MARDSHPTSSAALTLISFCSRSPPCLRPRKPDLNVARAFGRVVWCAADGATADAVQVKDRRAPRAKVCAHRHSA